MDLAPLAEPAKLKRKRVWKVIGSVVGVLICLLSTSYYFSIEEIRRVFSFIEVDNGIGFYPRMYAEKHKGFYPPLSREAGRLMYESNSISKDDLLFGLNSAFYRGEPGRMKDFNPAMSEEEFRRVAQQLLNDQSYYYLGYFVTNEIEGRAFINAYKETIARGGNFEGDLLVPHGHGNFGGDRLYRLRDEDALIRDLHLSEEVARQLRHSTMLLFQNPRKRSESYFPPPRRDEAFIYFAGHFGTTCKIPDRFPCTEEFLSALEKLDRMSGDNPPEFSPR